MDNAKTDRQNTKIKRIRKTETKRKRRPVPCTVCGKVFPDNNIRLHMETHDINREVVHCNLCGSKIQRKYDVARHQLSTKCMLAKTNKEKNTHPLSENDDSITDVLYSTKKHDHAIDKSHTRHDPVVVNVFDELVAIKPLSPVKRYSGKCLSSKCECKKII